MLVGVVVGVGVGVWVVWQGLISYSTQLFASIILTKTAGAKSKKLGRGIKTDGGTDPTIVSTSSQYDSVTSQT